MQQNIRDSASRKRTALLTTAFTKSHLNSHETQYLHIPVSGRGHFQGLRFRLLLGFEAPVSGHPRGNPLAYESYFNKSTSHRCHSEFTVIEIISELHKAIKTFILRTVPTNTEECFVQFMTMREKQILARTIGIQKENWG